MYEWRVMANYHFHRDEVMVYLGLRDGSNFHVVKPCPMILETHEIGAIVAADEPWLTLPGEALPGLFDALARHLFGEEAAQLRSELELTKRKLQTAESRLDRLIDGLAAAARATGATAPGKLPSGNQP